MITLEILLVQIVNGIVSGMILALVASGLTLIFGIMDVVNFAHGELFMVAGFFAYTLYVLLRVPYLLALLLRCWHHSRSGCSPSGSPIVP